MAGPGTWVAPDSHRRTVLPSTRRVSALEILRALITVQCLRPATWACDNRGNCQRTSERDKLDKSNSLHEWRRLMAMTARVKWIAGTRFVGESQSGHAVVMQGLPEAGEPSVGIRPMEMLLLGMGGCTAIDVVMILKKARENISDVVVELTGQRAESVPKVYERIHAHYVVTGHGLKESAVERAINLSAEKYCSATIMLAATAEVTHDFEIVETS